METSPADLAVAFRSFARRADQAIAEAEDDKARAHAVAAKGAAAPIVAQAAGLVHASTNGDLGHDCEAVAAAISAVHVDQWDDKVLHQLRDLAQQAGKALR